MSCVRTHDDRQMDGLFAVAQPSRRNRVMRALAIQCHIAGIGCLLAQGGCATCGAFVTKVFKCFVLRRFACAVLCLTLPLASPAQSAPFIQATSSAAERAGNTQADETIAFDIPPQSLLTALRSYSEVTGQAVLVDNTLTAGRNSAGVHGSFDKIEALQQLLAGTGLIASYSSDQAFTLKQAKPDESAGKTMREQPESLAFGGIEAVIEHYAGRIQAPIEQALCQLRDGRPGTYRLALQIWIASSGDVERTKLLSTTDNRRRDDDIRRTLDSLSLEPPPPGMPQPITLLLLPTRPTGAAMCADAAPLVH